MASASYSFLDIAVLDEVGSASPPATPWPCCRPIWPRCLGERAGRARFSAPPTSKRDRRHGAALTPVAQRQIQCAARLSADRPRQERGGAHRRRDEEPPLVSRQCHRLARRPAGAAVHCRRPQVSRKHPDSDAALIGGLTEPGRFAALIGADGEIIAASPGFGRLGIGAVQLTTLVAELRNEGGRLVKRHVEGAAGRVPAGLARLSDEPARYLLIVVDDSAGGSSVSRTWMRGRRPRPPRPRRRPSGARPPLIGPIPVHRCALPGGPTLTDG